MAILRAQYLIIACIVFDSSKCGMVEDILGYISSASVCAEKNRSSSWKVRISVFGTEWWRINIYDPIISVERLAGRFSTTLHFGWPKNVVSILRYEWNKHVTFLLSTYVVVSLFADDTCHTTIYLSTWFLVQPMDYSRPLVCSIHCHIQRKTVILPFGKQKYRASVALEQRINKAQSEIISPSVRIVRDGEICRILGPWLGNNVTYSTPWLPLIN